MKPSSQRALVWLLSVAAVLVPAAGIAYLGAVSYRDERGAVAARIEDQLRIAQRVAEHAEEVLRAAVEAAAATFPIGATTPDPGALTALAAREPLAREAFLIDAGGDLVWPSPVALGGDDRDDDFGRAGEGCAERGLEACVRDARTARRRDALFAAARGAEAAGRRADARRIYAQLVRFDDSAPEALVALARMARQADDPATAAATLRALGRIGSRRLDGVPVSLLAELGLAELDGASAPLLALYRDLVARRRTGPPAALLAAADRLSRRLHAMDLGDHERTALAELDERVAAARAVARAAAALLPDVADLGSAATAELTGRASLRDPSRSVVFHRRNDGAVVGVVVDAALLAAAATTADVAQVARRARAHIAPVTAPRSPHLRTLAAVPLGASLPHLTVALVNDRSDPDPLDDIIRQRSRRHLVVTGGLAVVLAIGLLATIRSAVRERELARLKSDFVSTVSHELKTPLTSIRMFAEMLEQGVAGGDAERISRYHGVIVKESQRLGLLIGNLLDYAQIERGTRRYSLRRERVDAAVADAVDTFCRLRDGAGQGQDGNEVRLDVSPSATGAEALVDRDVLIQAVLNLLANAAKYGGPGKPIAVRVDRAGPDITITVVDQGPGIPAPEHSRIFREFYRAPAAYSSGIEGTGLGLALVKRHVEAQGGTVEVASQPGRGAAFTVTLPAAAPPQVDAPGAP